MKRIETVKKIAGPLLPEPFLRVLEDRALTPRDVLVFDIETTGLSPKNAQIYLIGVAHLAGDSLKITQYFAERAAEEADVLRGFAKELAACKLLLHFYGDRFDLPFVKARCEAHALDVLPDITPMTKAQDNAILSCDVQKLLTPLKQFYGLSNCRLKTLEHLMGIPRTDMMSGGELISVYKDYCVQPTAEAEKLLLLHNEDDLHGTFRILSALQPLAYLEQLRDARSENAPFSVDATRLETYTDYDGNTQNECYLTLTPAVTLPQFTTRRNGVVMHCDGKSMVLRIPVKCGEMKHFFANYQDYYYLPYEDMAVHTSVGSFVDRTYRKKATAETAFVKRDGTFLFAPKDIGLPLFREAYRAKDSYIENSEELLSSESNLTSYALSLLHYLAGFS